MNNTSVVVACIGVASVASIALTASSVGADTILIACIVVACVVVACIVDYLSHQEFVVEWHRCRLICAVVWFVRKIVAANYEFCKKCTRQFYEKICICL